MGIQLLILEMGGMMNSVWESSETALKESFGYKQQ